MSFQRPEGAFGSSQLHGALIAKRSPVARAWRRNVNPGVTRGSFFEPWRAYRDFSRTTRNAAAFDGPSQLGVPVRAQDRLGGKPGSRKFATVKVRNVAPQIESAVLIDPYGLELGTEVSAGLPISLNATFKDQGKLDTQTAIVNWGDGSVQTSFDFFADAHSGALGTLAHDHSYAAEPTPSRSRSRTTTAAPPRPRGR